MNTIQIPNPLPTNPVWQLQPQEKAGDYFFSGRVLATALVSKELFPAELGEIMGQIRHRVDTQSGADYLQVFRHRLSGAKIFVIDQLSVSDLDGDHYTAEQKKENHYCTILFDYEY